jgi:hypothetical protein
MTDRSGPHVNKNIILIINTIAAFILPFPVASVNLALPTMGRAFFIAYIC